MVFKVIYIELDAYRIYPTDKKINTTCLSKRRNFVIFLCVCVCEREGMFSHNGNLYEHRTLASLFQHSLLISSFFVCLLLLLLLASVAEIAEFFL